ncbi:MAG: hypothetical protein ABSG49_04440 [Methanoregula sp.]|jgi:hypothetical protein|uniref:hypothetical protein n=1 Tax=Methanoregula sp. TaxID=2052170 RepID=UPI003C175446
MTDAVITEHAGSRQGTVVRYYQYGSGGVRVLDGGKVTRRLYLFDPSSNMMTERDPSRQEKILRRFVFDPYGMLEETFAFGQRPRTFRYEAGGQRIAVREGGEYGAVGKLFTFEENGVSETGWGRNGEIERVFIFEAGDDTITERTGGWFGNMERIIVFEGINASLFREPEAFLQFLMFTEWSDNDRQAHISDEVAKIRGGKPGATGTSPYAYTGPRHMTEDAGEARARGPAPRVPARDGDARPARTSRSGSDDEGIDFIADADAPPSTLPRGPPARRSDDISFEERMGRGDRETGRPSAGRSAEIPIQERFERARQEREPLSKGKSVEIPLDERFGSSREKEQLSRGGSVDIPLDERFEEARREREKLSKGKSAEIPYSERRGGGDR